MTPIAAYSPLITLDGAKVASCPAFSSPKPICRIPAINTANKKRSNEPNEAIWAATIAVNPAAGPLTLVCDPLIAPTTIPPTIPATKPETNGAPDAKATPRQSGNATRNTTNPAIKS